MPRFAVPLAVVGTLASVVGLVLFLAHLARQIRVETILDVVHDEAADTLRRSLEPRGDGPRLAALRPPPPPTTAALLAAESGFLVSLDEDDLLQAALDARAVITVDGFPGGSLVAGTPVGACWSLTGEPLADDVRVRLQQQVDAGINAGPERTTAQDIAFGLRQLTDVADKALSPGIDDPTTAVHALGHISALLCDSLDHALGPRLLHDDDGRVRVVLDRADFGDLLDTAISEPRRCGQSSPEVLARIARLLFETGWRTTDPADQAAVESQVRRLRQTIGDAEIDDTERGDLARALERVHDAIRHRP